MSRPELSTRQSQVVALVARGMPDKRIAHELGISIETVDFHIRQAAARIPGNDPPRRKFTLFFFGIDAESA